MNDNQSLKMLLKLRVDGQKNSPNSSGGGKPTAKSQQMGARIRMPPTRQKPPNGRKVKKAYHQSEATKQDQEEAKAAKNGGRHSYAKVDIRFMFFIVHLTCRLGTYSLPVDP